jgi:hypothetical protein
MTRRVLTGGAAGLLLAAVLVHPNVVRHTTADGRINSRAIVYFLELASCGCGLAGLAAAFAAVLPQAWIGRGPYRRIAAMLLIWVAGGHRLGGLSRGRQPDRPRCSNVSERCLCRRGAARRTRARRTAAEKTLIRKSLARPPAASAEPYVMWGVPSDLDRRRQLAVVDKLCNAFLSEEGVAPGTPTDFQVQRQRFIAAALRYRDDAEMVERLPLLQRFVRAWRNRYLSLGAPRSIETSGTTTAEPIGLRPRSC